MEECWGATSQWSRQEMCHFSAELSDLLRTNFAMGRSRQTMVRLYWIPHCNTASMIPSTCVRFCEISDTNIPRRIFEKPLAEMISNWSYWGCCWPWRRFPRKTAPLRLQRKPASCFSVDVWPSCVYCLWLWLFTGVQRPSALGIRLPPLPCELPPCSVAGQHMSFQTSDHKKKPAATFLRHWNIMLGFAAFNITMKFKLPYFLRSWDVL